MSAPADRRADGAAGPDEVAEVEARAAMPCMTCLAAHRQCAYCRDIALLLSSRELVRGRVLWHICDLAGGNPDDEGWDTEEAIAGRIVAARREVLEEAAQWLDRHGLYQAATSLRTGETR